MTPEQRFDIVLYRINSAKNLLDEIDDHIKRGYHNTAMNRMYYACFYAVSALLIHAEVDGVKTHEGVRQMFGKHFILTGLIPKEWGRFYTIVFNTRSAADYEDFKIYDLEATQEMYPRVCAFIELINKQIFPEEAQ